MKVLHTSDWHLGRSLFGRQRYHEFEQFLQWLSQTIRKHDVSLLIVSGDVFDTTTPSNRAQELYYQFLCRASSCCRHIVITGGNHDSPSFLEAPRELLRSLQVHVIAQAPSNPEDAVLLLKDDSGAPEAVVCAVPYLRDRDIRTAEAGEGNEEKQKKLLEGIREYYQRACSHAETLRAPLGDIPLIATGHLFAAGGASVEGDGVRELYIGTLAQVDTTVFPDSIDYLALGHLHSPQQTGGRPHFRYSGAPLANGFSEAGAVKQAVLVSFSGRIPKMQHLEVPVFQELVRITGTVEEIVGRITELNRQGSTAWAEVEYTGDAQMPRLRDLVDEAASGGSVEIRRIKNRGIIDQVLSSVHHRETLDDLDVRQVFSRRLDTWGADEQTRREMTELYLEVLRSIEEADIREQ